MAEICILFLSHCTFCILGMRTLKLNNWSGAARRFHLNIVFLPIHAKVFPSVCTRSSGCVLAGILLPLSHSFQCTYFVGIVIPKARVSLRAIFQQFHDITTRRSTASRTRQNVFNFTFSCAQDFHVHVCDKRVQYCSRMIRLKPFTDLQCVTECRWSLKAIHFAQFVPSTCIRIDLITRIMDFETVFNSGLSGSL